MSVYAVRCLPKRASRMDGIHGLSWNWSILIVLYCRCGTTTRSVAQHGPDHTVRERTGGTDIRAKDLGVGLSGYQGWQRTS